MRVPDFSSLAGCAIEDGGNMNIDEVNTNRIVNSGSEYATSTAKFVQQALKTSSSPNSYELMSLAANNTYKSFKEYYNHNNNNNNNNTIVEDQHDLSIEEDEEENENCMNIDELATGVVNQSDACFSASSSLSSISCNSKGYYIPRGIVNPNYPGFQHLAHTLSEHFIVSVPTTDESDFSDNDMDLSTDSCDDTNDKFNQNNISNAQKTENKLQKMGTSFETVLTLPAVVTTINNGNYQHRSLEHLESAPDILHNNSLPDSQPDLLFGTKVETVVAMTPVVDIIGDFGQEVEREFGLLVNGYKNLSVEQKSTAMVDDVVNDDKKKAEQIDNKVEFKPRYQRHSYDERQLPLIGVDYSRCQQKQLKSKNNKNNTIAIRKKAQSKTENVPPSMQTDLIKSVESDPNKDNNILSNNSRYAKISSWAQYLQATNSSSNEILTPNALELFDAYKISSEIDNDTLKKHLKLAKEIEKKRRNNREEIRRRLAGSDDEEINAPFSKRQEYENNLNTGYVSSDTESHSSDSETCPKLSSRKKHCKRALITNSPTPSKMSACAGPIGTKTPLVPTGELEYTAEDKECDFFTKQAVFQIETRMALAQSKEMANMQMKMQKKRQLVSPISEIVHQSMRKVGFQMITNKRRITRQILTNMSISHLQILVNSFHTHIEDFNEDLMNLLMKRDDLHLQQDELLSHIENMTRYLGVNFSQQKTYPV